MFVRAAPIPRARATLSPSARVAGSAAVPSISRSRPYSRPTRSRLSMKTMAEAGTGGRAHERTRADESPLLRVEMHQKNAAWRRPGGESACELEHRGGARRVVVRAGTHGCDHIGMEPEASRRAEVIVVRTDDDELAKEVGIRATDERSDVVSADLLAEEVLEVRDAARASLAPSLESARQPERPVPPRGKTAALSLPGVPVARARPVIYWRDTRCRRRCRPA